MPFRIFELFLPHLQISTSQYQLTYRRHFDSRWGDVVNSHFRSYQPHRTASGTEQTHFQKTISNLLSRATNQLDI